MNIFGLGLPELLIIVVIVLLFFGKDRLPGLFRSIGTSIKELRDGLTGESSKESNLSSDQTKDKHESKAGTEAPIAPEDR